MDFMARSANVVAEGVLAHFNLSIMSRFSCVAAASTKPFVTSHDHLGYGMHELL